MTNEAYAKFREVLTGGASNSDGVNTIRVIYVGTDDVEVGNEMVFGGFINNDNINSQYFGVSLNSSLSFESGDYSGQTTTTYVSKLEFGTGDPEFQLDFGDKLLELSFIDYAGMPSIEPYQIYTLSSFDIYFTEGA